MEVMKLSDVIQTKSTTENHSKGEIRENGESKCRECGEHIENFRQECIVPDFMGGALWYPWYAVCESCLERLELLGDQAEPSQSEKREREYLSICPLAMRETDASRLNYDLIHKVCSMPLSKKGLIFNGKTGTGKTRTMWLLVRELMVNRGLNVRVYDSTELKNELLEAREKRYAYKDLIEALVRCDILCIDDLGKEKTSDTWEQDLFAIIDRRTLNYKPMVITTNFVRGDMKEHYRNQGTLEPMFRRLAECFNLIPFKTLTRLN